MAIRIQKERTFQRTVKVRVPSATQVDAFDEGSFVGIFRALPRSKVDALSPKDDTRSDSQRITDFVTAILAGAQGFQDETGRDIAPGDAVNVILDDIALCTATIETFNKTYEQARAGN